LEAIVRLSEKSLELNIGAEILGILRPKLGFSKAYLRGLTQQEENREGADCFLQLSPTTTFLAFQFKAPKGKSDGQPYRFTINRQQHRRLYALAQSNPRSVFYVFPYYVTPQKLQYDLPVLAADTWLLDVGAMDPHQVFGARKTRTVVCTTGLARINPEFEMTSLQALADQQVSGIAQPDFLYWYDLQSEHFDSPKRRRSSSIFRGTRIVIAPPTASRVLA
jgi:hypothetical protein